MRKINLIIVDQDTEYLAKLTKYLRTGEMGQKFSCKTFSNKELLEAHLEAQGEGEVEVLLSTPKLLPANYTLAQLCLVLSEDQLSGQGEQLPCLAKYQPLNQLFTQVLTCYTEKFAHSGKGLAGTDRTKIIAVFSMSGGSGKTTFALNLACQLAWQDHKTFYLNLETANSLAALYPKEGDGFSRLLYHLQRNDHQLPLRIQQYKKHDGENRFSYFEPLANEEELQELTGEDVARLLQAFQVGGEYQYVIVDLDSTLDQRTLAVLNNSHHIYWLLLDNVVSVVKNVSGLESYMRQSGEKSVLLADRLTCLVNKHLGTIHCNLGQHPCFAGYETLPYIPRWKAVTAVNQLLAPGDFSTRVLGLSQALANRLEVSHGG